MKLSQALREVALLHAEKPGHRMFRDGICYAVDHILPAYQDGYDLMLDLMYSIGDARAYREMYAPFGDWTARPWMCLILAEYLEETGR